MLDTLITLIRFIQETSKSSSQGSKVTGHFSKQAASKEKATEPQCLDVQTPVCTEPRENIHQTISIIRRLVRNRWRPLGYANCAWGRESRLWSYTSTNGAIHPAPLSLGNYSCLFLATKSTGEWTPIKYISNLNAFMYCRAALRKHLGQSSGPSRRASG